MEPISERAIFVGALDKDPAERAAFLDEACGGDAALRRDVETLLRLHMEHHRFLDVPALEQLAAVHTNPESAADLSFLAPSSEPSSLGWLDHYEVLEVVGRGGMGVVLRARDSKLQRVVALKVLAAPLAVSGSARQRFVREARAAAAVRDERVIGIHAVCDDGPLPYLVMEFIDGCTLEALLRRGGPLEFKEILRIGIQIACGLAAAHKHGLIHRDVKPANILLENGVQRVKLTDFGLARAADDASLTQSGLIAGTPLYMAPEQALGEPIGPRADLFSLGSVLYELCTGRPAFRAPTTMAVIRRVCDETPRPIREINPDIPEPLCRLIERLQVKKPVDRPASAQEVADLLAGLLAGSQGQGPAESSVGTASPPAPRRVGSSHGWWWAAAAVALLAAGLGMGETSGVTDVRGTVVRLFSPQGTLVVEVDDPGVSVAVDGADLLISGAGTKEIRLKPGQYKVEASRNGKVVSRELVTVSRNGRRIVRISKELVPSSEAEAWEKAVAALPAEVQVAAVTRRLKECNLGFDDKVAPKVEDGVVTELQFVTDQVTDISPLRALTGLRVLRCFGSDRGKGRLADLSPLKGMKLTLLQCDRTQVADLSPLEGMQLTNLYCDDTRVSGLSPLKGMPLTFLTCNQTEVSDLSPLKDMKLTWLGCNGTRVSDLSPLKDMPLTFLTCGRTKVSDLSPLKDMPLTRLFYESTPVSDLSPLKGMHLTSMICFGTAVSDLSPLKGMPLELLNCAYTKVSDLSPLKDMSLTVLWFENTRVSDLSPLKDMPLTFLSCRSTQVSNLSLLKGMPLKELRCDFRPERDAEILRSIKTLEKINDKPAVDFWKEVEGQ